MNDFLQELETITQGFAQPEAGTITPTPQQQQPVVTNTPIQNPENPENWTASVAEQQDYQALNQEIEGDRKVSKLYVAVGSGVAALGTNATLGNWTLEQTYNPIGYLTFSGVLAVAIISGGLSGSRIEGRKFYSSPWFLSALGASCGVMSGAYASSRPYLTDKSVASVGMDKIQTEIREIEVKPEPYKLNLSDYGVGAAAILGVIAIALFTTRR
jgi:hypothetical protein